MATIEINSLAGLRGHYLFATLSDAQFADVVAHTRTRPFEAGQCIFNQGDVACRFWLVNEGSVKLYRVSALGQEKVMRLVGHGHSFAESVMFMDKPRYPVNAEGVEAGMLVGIDTSAYMAVLEASFATCRSVMTQMTQRIQSHWDEIEALTLQNGRYRVIHYLLALVPEGSRGDVRVTLPSRKALIATQLAVAPETLSRILNALNESGLIEAHDYSVRIPNLAALRQAEITP